MHTMDGELIVWVYPHYFVVDDSDGAVFYKDFTDWTPDSAYENLLTRNGVISRLYEISNTIIRKYREVINDCEWLDDFSKEQIGLKLDNMIINVLEPDCGYISYDDVNLVTTENGGSLLENYLLLKQNYTKELNKQIGTKANASGAWYQRTPMIENAFYDPENNGINITPGLINTNLYNSEMSIEEVYGKIGVIIAHEVSHAFDYQGSQYDYLGRRIHVGYM